MCGAVVRQYLRSYRVKIVVRHVTTYDSVATLLTLRQSLQVRLRTYGRYVPMPHHVVQVFGVRVRLQDVDVHAMHVSRVGLEDLQVLHKRVRLLDLLLRHRQVHFVMMWVRFDEYVVVLTQLRL